MVKIENRPKTLDIAQPHEYFYELFKDNVINEIKEMYKNSSTHTYEMLKNGEINWMDTILRWFYSFVNWTIKINDNSKKFHNFISFLEKELSNLGQCIYDIDTTIYYLQNPVPISQKNLLLAHHLLHKLHILLSEHIILKLSSLFDLEGYGKRIKAKKNLEFRYDFVSYKNDIETLQDNSEKSYLSFLQKFINILYVKVNEWRENFNTYKHNYSDNDLDKLELPEIKLQDIFNIWYVMYDFILPMLKILHGWKKDNNFFYNNICFRSILFETNVEEIYELLKRNDNFEDA